MNRVYQCGFAGCPDSDVRTVIKGQRVGPLWVFPDVVCGCGMVPMLVDPLVVDARAERLQIRSATSGV